MSLTPTQIREMINDYVISAFTSMGINDLSLFPTIFHAFHSSIALSTSLTPSTWFLDSRTSIHMKSMEQNIHDSQTYVGCEKIATADEHHFPIFGIRSLELLTPQNKSFYLSNFYFVRQ